MIPFSLYIKEYSWSYDQKYYKFSYYISLYFSSLNLKYLKLTKMGVKPFLRWNSSISLTLTQKQTLTIVLVCVNLWFDIDFFF